MELHDHNFARYAFSAQPNYDEPTVRRAFAKAVPLRTVVIYCFDPRAVGIPEAVAREFGEVYPGEIVIDEHGNKVATTTSVFEIVVAGGRAVDALRSITVAQHLFGIKNVVIVHHSHCGATSYTSAGIVDAFKHEHGQEIGDLYDPGSVSIGDYSTSLEHDATLVRQSRGTPQGVDIFGYFYNIDTGELTRVVEDIGAVQAVQNGQSGH